MFILLVLTPIRESYHTYTSPILDTMEAVEELSRQFPNSLRFTLCLNKRALTEYPGQRATVQAARVDSLITLKSGG